MIKILADNIVIYLPLKYSIAFSDSASDNKSYLEFFKKEKSILIRFYGNFANNPNYQRNPQTRFDIYIQLGLIQDIIEWLKENFQVTFVVTDKDTKISSSLPDIFRKGPVHLPKISSSNLVTISEAIVQTFECVICSKSNNMYVEIEENKVGVHKHLKGKQLHLAVRCKISEEKTKDKVYGQIIIDNLDDFICAIYNISQNI